MEIFLCKHCVAAVLWNKHTALWCSDEINRNVFIFNSLKLKESEGGERGG